MCVTTAKWHRLTPGYKMIELISPDNSYKPLKAGDSDLVCGDVGCRFEYHFHNLLGKHQR